MNFKNKNEFQKYGLKLLRDNGYNGCIVADTGASKSKIAIDAIKEGNFKNILITSPRTNLKENWRNELNKWGFANTSNPRYFLEDNKSSIIIDVENIQTCYKWDRDIIGEFDLIIADEAHKIFSPEYSKIITTARELNIPVIGLTATPDYKDKFRKEFYPKYCPILIEYHSAEEDGLTNKTKYWVYEYKLSDNYKVLTGTKTKKWLAGEAKQYTYLSERYEEAKNMMFELGATEYFETSLLWMKGKVTIKNPIPNKEEFIIHEFTKEQKEAGRKFFNSIRYRKNFLWNLESSKQIALEIKNKILLGNFSQCKITKEYKDLFSTQNKVLVFSELTSQAEKLSKYSIHSNIGKTAKETEQKNKELLERFNNNEIRELSSVRSLQLGLNLNNVTHAIFESYSGSDTNAKQAKGRLNRLDTEQVANVIIIKPLNTQMGDNWFNSAFGWIEDYTVINNVNELII